MSKSSLGGLPGQCWAETNRIAWNKPNAPRARCHGKARSVVMSKLSMESIPVCATHRKAYLRRGYIEVVTEPTEVT